MSFLFFRKKENEINGIIKYLNLNDFWRSCNAEEQEALVRYYQSGLGFYTSPIEGSYASSSETPHKYLSAMLGWAAKEKNWPLADKLISAGLQIPVNSSNCIDTHVFFQEAAECYYKQRETRPDAISLTTDFCEKDIALLPLYSTQMKVQFGTIPRIQTVQRLAIIYEKLNRIQDAIELCNMAIRCGLSDGTKGGYLARLNRLEKKN